MTSDAAPLLSVSGLERAGIEVPDFALAAGEALAISGPSGSGKSLFLRALADLDPSDGAVALAGADRNSMPAPRWRRQVTYVPAESGWWAERVCDHFEDWDAAAPAAARLGIPAEAGDWSVSRLSTGERQRLALLRALVQGARVLLLDEPTSGLDVEATWAVEARLREFLSDGGAMILVTHDPAQARRLAKRALRFERGVARPERRGQ
ncbi:MAG: ATP-binding cassette domain-containing protein [Rhodospirillales bacterium]|nr:MAG: ATP-binding cassette domain-containing protein [Rhodospirillales bacterium]